MSRDTIVYYHAKCNDGFGSALAAWMKLGDKADYIPLAYGEKMPEPADVAGKFVYAFDLGFSPELTLDLAASAASFILIDHHASVMEQWIGEGGSLTQKSFIKQLDNGMVKFDMNKSGAMLAWEFMHGNKPAPSMFRYIQDYDLGKTFRGCATPGTDEYIARLGLEAFDFELWAEFANQHVVGVNPRYRNESLEAFLAEGRTVLSALNALATKIADGRVYEFEANGHRGLAANVSGPPELINRVGHILADRCGTFGMLWNTDGEKVSLSFRSVGDFDVKSLAIMLGGGGHKNAAGGTISIDQFMTALQARSFGKLTPVSKPRM